MPPGSPQIAVSFVVMLAMLGELVALGFVLRRRPKEKWTLAGSWHGRIDVKYAVMGGVLVLLGFVVRQTLGFATVPVSILLDAIPAVLWGVGLAGVVSSPRLGQRLGARPLWIGLSLVLAFALGAAGGLPAI